MSGRIDWRNYDYSAGPPRLSSSVSTHRTGTASNLQQQQGQKKQDSLLFPSQPQPQQYNHGAVYESYHPNQDMEPPPIISSTSPRMQQLNRSNTAAAVTTTATTIDSSPMTTHARNIHPQRNYVPVHNSTETATSQRINSSYIDTGGCKVPKSRDDLTLYEDELLQKITTVTDLDRKLIYRPPNTAYPPTIAPSVNSTNQSSSTHSSLSSASKSTHMNVNRSGSISTKTSSRMNMLVHPSDHNLYDIPTCSSQIPVDEPLYDSNFHPIQPQLRHGHSHPIEQQQQQQPFQPKKPLQKQQQLSNMNYVSLGASGTQYESHSSTEGNDTYDNDFNYDDTNDNDTFHTEPSHLSKDEYLENKHRNEWKKMYHDIIQKNYMEIKDKSPEMENDMKIHPLKESSHGTKPTAGTNTMTSKTGNGGVPSSIAATGAAAVAVALVSTTPTIIQGKNGENRVAVTQHTRSKNTNVDNVQDIKQKKLPEVEQPQEKEHGSDREDEQEDDYKDEYNYKNYAKVNNIQDKEDGEKNDLNSNKSKHESYSTSMERKSAVLQERMIRTQDIPLNTHVNNVKKINASDYEQEEGEEEEEEEESTNSKQHNSRFAKKRSKFESYDASVEKKQFYSHKKSTQMRTEENSSGEEEEDEESLQLKPRNRNKNYPKSTLKNRAYAAKKNDSTRSKRVPVVGFVSDDQNEIREFTPDEISSDKSSNSDEDDDTLRSEDFTYQSEEYTEITADDTYAGRSLNSVYTKSNFSELEDFFSDLLLLGSGDYRNPGRRPVKYKSNRRKDTEEDENSAWKRKRERVIENQKYAEDVFEGIDEESASAGESCTLTTIDEDKSQATRTNENSLDFDTSHSQTLDDTYEEEHTFLESVDEEATYDEVDDESSSHLERYRKRYSKDKRGDADKYEDEGASSSPLSALWGFVESGVAAINQALSSDTHADTSFEEVHESSGNNQTRYYNNDESNKLRGSDVKGGADEVGKKEKDAFIASALNVVFPQTASESSSYQKDHEMEKTLVEVALSAARARHAAKGLIYDETTTFDVVRDIKLVSFSVPLPIGILFEESKHCCWVSRIFDKGNAAKVGRGGQNKVLLGDHIVAVNDASVVYHSVPKLCKVLSKSRDPTCVNLTFLRYVGPIRHSSANLEHEGYEVIDPILSAKGPNTGKVSRQNLPKMSDDQKLSRPPTRSANDLLPTESSTRGNIPAENNTSQKPRLFRIFKRKQKV